MLLDMPVHTLPLSRIVHSHLVCFMPQRVLLHQNYAFFIKQERTFNAASVRSSRFNVFLISASLDFLWLADMN